MPAKLQNSSTWCKPAAGRWVSNVTSQHVVNSMMTVWTHYLGVSGTTSIHRYASHKNCPSCIMITLKFCGSGTKPEVMANGSCCPYALKQKLLPKTVLLTIDSIFVCKCLIVRTEISSARFQWLYINIFFLMAYGYSWILILYGVGGERGRKVYFVFCFLINKNPLC